MKKPLLYFLAGILLTVSVSMFMAFRAKSDVAGTYASVKLLHDANMYAIFAYSEGNPEEIKFDKGKSDPEMIMQVTNKMEAKGYTLEHFIANATGYDFIFRKRL
jgi:hypothetical protein